MSCDRRDFGGDTVHTQWEKYRLFHAVVYIAACKYKKKNMSFFPYTKGAGRT